MPCIDKNDIPDGVDLAEGAFGQVSARHVFSAVSRMLAT